MLIIFSPCTFAKLVWHYVLKFFGVQRVPNMVMEDLGGSVSKQMRRPVAGLFWVYLVKKKQQGS